MRKNWAIFGAIVAAGFVSWNEYRVWTARNQLHVPMAPTTNTASEVLVPWVPEGGLQVKEPEPVASSLPAGEEECDATIIDLTVLQQQTIEPPLADTIAPPVAIAPCKNTTCEFRVVPYVLPNVPQFRPYSADTNDCCGQNACEMCAKLSEFIANLSKAKSGKANECEPEVLTVMPRLIEASSPDSPNAGVKSSNASPSRRARPDSSGAGEEQQDKPPSTPKTPDPHKQPRVDTMEIRPGDLPFNGVRKPF